VKLLSRPLFPAIIGPICHLGILSQPVTNRVPGWHGALFIASK
jgi:hypothetical protein